MLRKDSRIRLLINSYLPHKKDSLGAGVQVEHLLPDSKEIIMKRHKKVLFDQIKEEDQGKRKKRSSTIYYFATEAFLNILKIVLIIVGSLALSVTVSVIVTAINNGQAPNTAVLSSWVKLKGFFHLLFNLNNN